MKKEAQQRQQIHFSIRDFCIWVCLFIAIDTILNVFIFDLWLIAVMGDSTTGILDWRGYAFVFMVKVIFAPQYPIMFALYFIIGRFDFVWNSRRLAVLCVFTAILGYLCFFLYVGYLELKRGHWTVVEMIEMEVTSWIAPSSKNDFTRHSSLFSTLLAAPLVNWYFQRFRRK